MLAGLTVLLAEDNATNQLVAVQMLEALGAEVEVASDGAEALETLAAKRFDVLLIDIEMPQVSGIEVIRRLRRPGSGHETVPMIALTAYVMHEHRRQIRAAGADGIIAKPIMSVERLGEEILGFMAEAARTRCGGATGAQGRPGTAVTAPSGGRAPARSAGAVSSGEGVVDDRVIDELADTVGATALRGVLERAIEDIASAGADLEEALALDDATRARRASHVISGLAGVVGAERLGALARAVHDASPPSDAGVRPQDAARLVDATLRALEARSRATLAS